MSALSRRSPKAAGFFSASRGHSALRPFLTLNRSMSAPQSGSNQTTNGNQEWVAAAPAATELLDRQSMPPKRACGTRSGSFTRASGEEGDDIDLDLCVQQSARRSPEHHILY